MTQCSSTSGRSDNAIEALAFEGREKRLDVRFVRIDGVGRRRHYHHHHRLKHYEGTDDIVDDDGLRSLSDATLQHLSGCAVAFARRDADGCCYSSKTRRNGMDAFILSESSLFVFARRWVVKTCGQARMLRTFADLLRHAEMSGLRPIRVTYSRGAYLFPGRQQPPHHPEFEREEAHVRECLRPYEPKPKPEPTSSSSVIELSSSSDAALTRLSRSRSCCDETPHDWGVYEWKDTGNANDDDEEEDDDVEVCASGMSVESSEMFTAKTGFAGREAVKTFVSNEAVSALAADSADDVSVASVDDLCFGDCGYSLNAVIVRKRPYSGNAPEVAYVTVHVTPEPHCLPASYVSIEASIVRTDNADNDDCMARMAAAIPAFVCRVFRPRGVTCMVRRSKDVSHFVSLPHPPPDYRVTSAFSLVPRIRWWEAVSNKARTTTTSNPDCPAAPARLPEPQ